MHGSKPNDGRMPKTETTQHFIYKREKRTPTFVPIMPELPINGNTHYKGNFQSFLKSGKRDADSHN